MKFEIHPNPPGFQPLRSLPVGKFGRDREGLIYMRMLNSDVVVCLNGGGYSNKAPISFMADLDRTLIEVLPTGTRITITSE